MMRRLPIFIAGGIIAALLTGFGLIADEVVEGDTMNFDMSVLLALRTPGNPADPIVPALAPGSGP